MFRLVTTVCGCSKCGRLFLGTGNSVRKQALRHSSQEGCGPVYEYDVPRRFRRQRVTAAEATRKEL
jgi:hypothetical protein